MAQRKGDRRESKCECFLKAIFDKPPEDEINKEKTRVLLKKFPPKANNKKTKILWRKLIMKKLTLLLAAVMVFCFAAPVFAAPVFPDVPEEHWARDAVANLAANGLVEGYPDGTFKGDRAATRYELAMVIARFLAKNEQEHATFATKADLEELRKLVNQLKSELDALGVRVTNLEDAVGKLDKRVTELERITFYGEIDSIFVTQGFNSCSTPFTFNGGGWVTERGDRYQGINGTPITANFHPVVDGVMPTMDYRNGRPLTNGSGLTVTAKFGINAKVSEDVDAGLELAAYSSIGDPVVNMYYGTQAPYSSNVFTATGNTQQGFGFGNANLPGNSPWTRMTLDNFWVKHKPSGIKLVVGSFGELNMDSILYAGEPNPNVNGPKYINNYGFRVFGSAHIISDMDWEVFYTTLPDGQPLKGDVAGAWDGAGNITDTDYNTYAYGFSLGWHFKGGNFKLGYLRAMNDYTTNRNDAVTNSVSNAFGGYGYATIAPNYVDGNNTMFGWVNPSGYYAQQMIGDPNAYAVTPIDGFEGGTDLYGPQATTNWSAHFDYTWEDSKIKPHVFLEYASSDWTPNVTSGWHKTGSAIRAGIGATFFNDSLDVDLGYKSIEPWYDPFTLRFPVAINSMWRLPNFSYYPNMYQLHDSDIYTNNREGWNIKLTYRFKDEKGKIWVSYEGLEQVETNRYDITHQAGTLGIATPTVDVLGYTPGFIDSVFTAYDRDSYSLTPGATNWGATADDNTGKTTHWAIGFDYKFNNNLELDLNYYNRNFKRDTSLHMGQVVTIGNDTFNTGDAANANYINFDVTGFHIGLAYPFNEKFTGKIGYDHTTIKGHYDPSNLQSAYAWSSNSHDFRNIDMTQSVPYIGFDYKLSQNTEWGLNLQFFSTKDNIADGLRPNPVAVDHVTDNPYSWNGTQLMTEFKVKF